MTTIDHKEVKMFSFRLPEKSKLRRKSTISEFEPSKVDSEFAKQAEIRTIVERHLKTGQPLPTKPLVFSDVSGIPADLQERLTMVEKGKEAWTALPAALRRRYRTPEEFLAALHDSEEHAWLEKFGILQKAPETTVSKPDNAVAASGNSGGTSNAGGASAPSGTSST